MGKINALISFALQQEKISHYKTFIIPSKKYSEEIEKEAKEFQVLK